MSTIEIAMMGLCLALLVAVYVRLSGLPRGVSEIVRQERARETSRAQSALQEATAVRVGAIVQALRAHEDELVVSLRVQIADAQARARVAERRESDVGAALGAAVDLVRDLYTLRDQVREMLSRAALPPLVSNDGDQRETTELPRPAAPGLAPPGSAVPLPSEPAITAAGLGPRPGRPPSSRRSTLLGVVPPQLGSGTARTLPSMQAVPGPTSGSAR